jgi:hypothetical protein
MFYTSKCFTTLEIHSNKMKLGPIMTYGGPKIGPIIGPGQAWAHHGPRGGPSLSPELALGKLGPTVAYGVLKFGPILLLIVDLFVNLLYRDKHGQCVASNAREHRPEQKDEQHYKNRVLHLEQSNTTHHRAMRTL